MNIKQIIDDIIDAETPADDPRTPQDERAIVTNRKNDLGGRTQWGIAEKANPQAWLDGKVTEQESRDIYAQKYIFGPGFDKVTDPNLQSQLIDFGVNSGPGIAIQKLQAILKVEQDGQLGPKTLAALEAADPKKVNNQLALERIKMIGRLVNKRPAQAENLNGWLERAIKWIRL